MAQSKPASRAVIDHGESEIEEYEEPDISDLLMELENALEGQVVAQDRLASKIDPILRTDGPDHSPMEGKLPPNSAPVFERLYTILASVRRCTGHVERLSERVHL